MKKTDVLHLDASQLARKLSSQVETVWLWVRRDGLPCHRHKQSGKRARLCFSWPEIERWADARQKEGRSITETESTAARSEGEGIDTADTGNSPLARLEFLERDTFLEWQRAISEGRPSRQLHRLYRNAAVAYVRAHSITNDRARTRLRAEIVAGVTALLRAWRIPIAALLKQAQAELPAKCFPARPEAAASDIHEWVRQLTVMLQTDPLITLNTKPPTEDSE